MSNKMRLPDQLLDAISGGTLTFGGEEITELAICSDGFEITTKSGTESVLYNPSMQKAYDSGAPQFDQMIEGLEKLHNNISGKWALEDLLDIK